MRVTFSQYLFGIVAFMLSTVDNSKRQKSTIPKHDHDWLWNALANKAGDIGKQRTRVGIPT